MKKKLTDLPQLNKNYIVKFFIFLAVVILLEVLTAILIFNQFATKTYRQEYATYDNKAEYLSTVLKENYSEAELNDLNEATQREKAIQTCTQNGGFDGYLVFTFYQDSTDGRIIQGNDELNIETG